MAISIKDSETDRLAREVASATGESLTTAIANSLRERLDRLHAASRTTDLLSDLRAIAKRCATLPELDSRSSDAILGYDERGLPV